MRSRSFLVSTRTLFKLVSFLVDASVGLMMGGKVAENANVTNLFQSLDMKREDLLEFLAVLVLSSG